MSNILWVLAAVNIVYLAYALRKKQLPALKTSLADQIRILTVPEQHLAIRPIPKSVQIKNGLGTEDNWWDKKIPGASNKGNGRRNHEPDQLFLSDTDSTLR